MAAPIKEGLDYFPFSVDLLDDEALERVRDEYGMMANEIYILTLCYLYKKHGYYIPYGTQKEKSDLTWFIYKRIKGGKYQVQQAVVPRVIEAWVAQGLFSGELYPRNITSERAQATYYSATVERTAVAINREIWLLSDSTMRKLSKRHPYYISLHPENKSYEKRSNSYEKPSKSDEKSLNKIKGNIKEKYIKRKGKEAHFTNEHKYTSEECESMIDDIMALEI